MNKDRYLYLEKEVENQIIVISDDTEYLSQKINEKVPVILLLNDNNKDKDTSKIKYAITEINDEVLSEDYLKYVIFRSKNIPLIITETENLLIRELDEKDSEALQDLYSEEDSDYIENIFGNKEENKKYLCRYIEEVYKFYDFGIWGVYLKDDNILIGITGFSPREKSIEKNKVTRYYLKDGQMFREDAVKLELGFAYIKKYRNKGYAYEAATAVIEYARNNICHSALYLDVDNNNLPALKLAAKLKK